MCTHAIRLPTWWSGHKLSQGSGSRPGCYLPLVRIDLLARSRLIQAKYIVKYTRNPGGATKGSAASHVEGPLSEVAQFRFPSYLSACTSPRKNEGQSVESPQMIFVELASVENGEIPQCDANRDPVRVQNFPGSWQGARMQSGGGQRKTNETHIQAKRG